MLRTTVKKSARNLKVAIIVTGCVLAVAALALRGGAGPLRTLVFALIALVVLYFQPLVAVLRTKTWRTPELSESLSGGAVIVYLSGNTLPKEIYEEYDVSTLEDQLEKVLQENRLGEYDGNERGPAETVMYIYGPDAEKIFAAVHPTLEAYPLCVGARAVIRKAGPGSEQREAFIGGAKS